VRFLTREEGVAWLAAAGLPPLEESRSDCAYVLAAQCSIPNDAGRKTALARMLIAPIADSEGRGMLWITAHGVWPSSENIELFYALRRAFGEGRRLPDSPCHVFDRTAAIAAECILDVTLYFAWDATLYLPNAASMIKFSHDEILEIYSRTPFECAALVEGLKQFGLREV